MVIAKVLHDYLSSEAFGAYVNETLIYSAAEDIVDFGNKGYDIHFDEMSRQDQIYIRRDDGCYLVIGPSYDQTRTIVLHRNDIQKMYVGTMQSMYTEDGKVFTCDECSLRDFHDDDRDIVEDESSDSCLDRIVGKNFTLILNDKDIGKPDDKPTRKGIHYTGRQRFGASIPDPVDDDSIYSQIVNAYSRRHMDTRQVCVKFELSLHRLASIVHENGCTIAKLEKTAGIKPRTGCRYLTDDDVIQIYDEAAANPKTSLTAIGDKYGISRSMAGDILRCKTHIDALKGRTPIYRNIRYSKA